MEPPRAENYTSRQVVLSLPDYILTKVDAARGNTPRATFLRRLITDSLGVANIYTGKQAWRLLSREQRTERQKRVIQLHLEGKNQRRIGEEVGLSQGRVCTIISNYYKTQGGE